MTQMGRPKKSNAKRKSLTIRMSEDTHRKLSEYAAKHKMILIMKNALSVSITA